MIKQILKVTIVLVGLWSAFPLWASCSLAGYQATYHINLGKKSLGTYERSVSFDKDHYRASANTSIDFHYFIHITDQINASGYGAVNQDGIPEPTRYQYSEAKHKTQYDVRFNQSTSKMTVFTDGVHKTYPIKASQQDPLSAVLAIRLALLNHKGLPVLSVTQINAQRALEMVTYNLVLGKTSTMSTGLGSLEVVEVRETNPKTHVVNHLWFAPKYDYLLVKSLIPGERGNFIMNIQQYTPNNSCLESL